jgi:hypothetical protein
VFHEVNSREIIGNTGFSGTVKFRLGEIRPQKRAFLGPKGQLSIKNEIFWSKRQLLIKFACLNFDRVAIP